MAEKRERMERLREEDRRRFAEENERRIHDVRLQMEQLHNLVVARHTTTTFTRGTHRVYQVYETRGE